jgi:hypothetical protein
LGTNFHHFATKKKTPNPEPTHTKGYFVKIMCQSRQISRTKLFEVAIFRQLAPVGSQNIAGFSKKNYSFISDLDDEATSQN